MVECDDLLVDQLRYSSGRSDYYVWLLLLNDSHLFVYGQPSENARLHDRRPFDGLGNHGLDLLSQFSSRGQNQT